ncbi:MAG: methionyl-tRNA formyltransferase, partial [Candidatus Sericytochromatia bacterium]|nr:methionyl-tRNA formyltransferase [Candidatus Tanganyikabacteria bacterium]
MPSIVFMGTPAFAVPSLKALIDARYQVLAAVTQPDKPAGRGQKLQPPAVKVLAQEAGIPVLQPGRLRKEPESVERIRALKPDAIVVVAFGQILPQDVLDIPPAGCINVHGSLLPAYRGAGPVQWALINGERATGVTTMLMDAGMDTGPMFLKREMEILPDDDAGSLGARMSRIGADLLLETLAPYFAGSLEARVQPAEGVSMAPMLKKEHGELDFAAPAVALHSKVRGVT